MPGIYLHQQLAESCQECTHAEDEFGPIDWRTRHTELGKEGVDAINSRNDFQLKLFWIEKDLRERIARYASGAGKGGLYSIMLKELNELMNKHFTKLPYGGLPEDENEKDG